MRKPPDSDIKEFQRFIWEYFDSDGREFPWRDTDNHLHALVAEIMLQQTSYYQVLPQYKSFCKSYIKPEDVVTENTEELENYFEGLGLQSRAEYVKCAAKYLIETDEITQKGLLQVNGIGRYTANAFMSVHLEKRYPIVDGNVLRVLQERFEVDEELKTSDDEIWELAWDLLPEIDVREYNLGLIDYGAELYGKNPD